MSGYLWKATVRNVNRALKEINAFEWEGDYRLYLTITGSFDINLQVFMIPKNIV